MIGRVSESVDDPSGPRSGSAQSVETVVLVLLGSALGLLVLLLPVEGQGLASTALMYAALLANSTALLVELRQRRRSRTADGATPDPATGMTLLNRPSVRRTYAVVLGVLITQLTFFADSPLVRTLLLVLFFVVVVSSGPLVRRSQRRQLAAAHAEHPDQVVVLVALVDLATMRLAQWAKAARATLPAEVGRRGMLLADAEGLAFHRAGRPARLVHRWAWGDVELSSSPHPEDHDAAVLVLTLLGPTPAPRARETPVGRRRFDVTLSVRDGATPVRSGAVDAQIAMLESHRPATATAR